MHKRRGAMNLGAMWFAILTSSAVLAPNPRTLAGDDVVPAISPVTDDELAQARAEFLAVYEGQGRPRVEVIVNERVGTESAKLRGPLRTLLGSDGAVAFAERQGIAAESRTILTRLNRLHPSIRPRTDLPALSADIGLLIQVDAEPSAAGFAAVARAFDTASGIPLGECSSPIPPVWTTAEGERVARQFAAELFRAVAQRWAAAGAVRDFRLHIDGVTSAERVARTSAALKRLPGIRGIGEPTRSESLREADWTLTAAGDAERLALDLRTAIAAALDTPIELRSWGSDSIELRAEKKGERPPSTFTSAYQRAGRPRIAVIFGVMRAVSEPDRPDSPLVIGAGPDAAVEVQADVRSLDDVLRETELSKLLRLANHPIVATMTRTLSDDGVEVVTGEAVSQLPWKSGRHPNARPDGRVMLPLELARPLAGVLILGETTIERATGESELTGTAYVLVRAVDTRTAELLARAEQRWPYNPQFIADYGQNQGPSSALEGAAMRLADSVMRGLTEHWLGGPGFELTFDRAIPNHHAGALAACLFDRAGAALTVVPTRDASGMPTGQRVWFDGTAERCAAALRAAVDGVPAWSRVSLTASDGRITIRPAP